VDVKRRLNAPYQKEQSQMAKLQKALKPEEFAAAMVNMTNREQRLESLDKQFLELETHYRSVLEKIAAA
jgi:histone acetyltransferase 1